MNHPSPLSLPSAMLFDMDGTITEPMLDFAAIKAEMGIGARPILEAMAEMDENRRAAAQAVLDRHERYAAEHSTLSPGCRALLGWLSRRGISTALITRNCRHSVQTVLNRHQLTMGALVTREDPPFKPHPDALRLACSRLNVPIHRAWMIGDGQYDIEAGLAAGARTVWISRGNARPFAAEPWRMVRDLKGLQALLYAIV